jgi:hypothetical protein
MFTRTVGALLLIGTVAMAMPAVAHHSNSGFDVEKIIEIRGTVSEWRWTNPHTWIVLTGVDDGAGGTTSWSAEGRPPGVLGRAGWSRNSIKVGDRVGIHCSPAKDGTRVCLVARVTLADGTVLANAPPPTF